ncbi:MAG: hypothetical protein ACM3UY_09330 [Methanocella sp.]|jgi:hypothetical protein
MANKIAIGSGLGLVFGAAVGTVLFALSNSLWYILAGAAVGLIVGIIASNIPHQK